MHTCVVTALLFRFYVNDVSLLEDEVTRYHYFLQLKLDVIEGRLRCNYEQAIVLASYSLQAEFGDHDPEKHTLEYLQDFPLLPKPILQQFPEEKLSTLTDAIITQHSQLRGIAQQLAEVYYIVGAQQLDGYGQECFLAKDETGNEVLIGASLTGIVVRKGPNASSPQFFKWNDITNLVNHRRCFGIECQNYEYSAQFLLEEADSAKYVWKMCKYKFEWKSDPNWMKLISFCRCFATHLLQDACQCYRVQRVEYQTRQQSKYSSSKSKNQSV